MANKEQIDLKTRRAARLTAQGVSRSDIAKKLGVSSRTLRRYESSTAFSDELQTIIKSERQTVGATLTSAARRALGVLIDGLEARDPKLRLRAAATILERYSQFELAMLRHTEDDDSELIDPAHVTVFLFQNKQTGNVITLHAHKAHSFLGNPDYQLIGQNDLDGEIHILVNKLAPPPQNND